VIKKREMRSLLVPNGRALTLAAVAAWSSSAGCAGERAASASRAPTVVSTAQNDGEPNPPAGAPPPRESTDAACNGEGLPPSDVIAANVVDTELTAFGEITSAKVTATDGSEPAPSTGYVHFIYEVDLVQQFTGERLEHIRLIQGAEAGAKIREPGVLLFFSACMSDDGSGFEPDVGYFFPMNAACRKQIAELATAGAKNLPDPERRGSACRE
jgi:hypothetical protein